MKKRLAIPTLCLLLLIAWLASLVLPATASPEPQIAYFTPTPRPDGRIIYVVKENDTCIRIALLHKISEEQLRNLNNLRGQNCIIQVGQELLIGLAGPADTPTPGPSPTPTPLLPTPTPLPGKGSICIILFEDINGNGLLEEKETLLLGGAVSITNSKAGYSQTGITLDDPANPLCYEDIPEGEYNISLAVPQGYNPTTFTSRTLKLVAGDTSTLDFGAQISLKNPPNSSGSDTVSRVPLLGVLGAFLILAGIGMAIYLRRMMK